MAKVRIVDNALIVTSSTKLEVIKALQKFEPESLVLINQETKDEIFVVREGHIAAFSKFGTVFTGENTNGQATLTLTLPTGLPAEDKETYVEETYGHAILNLNYLELQIAEHEDALIAAIKDIKDSITVE